MSPWGRGVNKALYCVQRLRIVPRCSPLSQGISKTPPIIIFCPMYIFGGPGAARCQLRQVWCGGAEVGDFGRLVLDQVGLTDSKSEMLGQFS